MSLTTVHYPCSAIAVVDRPQIEDLKQAAVADPLGRARICLHMSPADPIHEMVIAIRRGSYSRPHRNVRQSKSYFAIDGRIALIIFDDSGKIVERICLEPGSAAPFFCRLNSNCWHTVVACSDMAVFLETNGGPFIKEQEEYAPWAPDNHEAEVESHLNAIERIAHEMS